MKKIFYPDSIVIIGVSESADNLARSIAENIIGFHFKGKLYFVGRKPGQLANIPIYNSIEPLPENIDLAIILTPAATVPGFVEKCARKGIRNLIIESGGFSEFSAEGKALEEQIAALAEQWDLKIVGPNCIGIINTFSGINSLFVKMQPEELLPGCTSLLAQSGGIVLTLTDMLTEAGLGVGKTASVGNKLVLKESDYLEYYLNDPDTDIVLLYLESIDEGRRMIELARTSPKPIIVYKSNNSEASAHVAQSHTAALANDDRIVNAVFKQSGITRAQTFRDLALLAKGFSMPPVRGNRLCVFSRSGGHAIVSVDSATEFGFVLPAFPDELMEIAKPYFRVNVINSSNPLDMGTVFNFDAYPRMVEECLRIVKPDAILLVFNYRRESIPQAREIAQKVAALSRQFDTPVALIYLTETEEVAYLQRNLGYPVFSEVYDAVKVLAASRDRYALQQQLDHPLPAPAGLIPADACERARQILAGMGGRQPLINEALEICSAYGLPVAPWALAKDASEACREAKKVGYPLAVKAVGASLLHKSDMGGVALNIGDEEGLLAAIQTMQARIHAAQGEAAFDFLLQAMAPKGHEVILGGKRDRGFGAVVLFGLGGIFVEVYNDTTLRAAPLTTLDARQMIAEIKGSKLLRGARGQAPANTAAIEESLLKLSQLLVDLPEVAEIDINPLIVDEHCAQVVDARIILE